MFITQLFCLSQRTESFDLLLLPTRVWCPAGAGPWGEGTGDARGRPLAFRSPCGRGRLLSALVGLVSVLTCGTHGRVSLGTAGSLTPSGAGIGASHLDALVPLQAKLPIGVFSTVSLTTLSWCSPGAPHLVGVLTP